MKLEDLKAKATTSEMALIDTVEKLVRGEYDRDLIEKDIHHKLKNEIYASVVVVLKRHNVLSSYGVSRYDMNWCERDRLKEVLYEIGDAIRLELKEDAKEI